MSNLDAIRKKLEAKKEEATPLSIPEGKKRKKKEVDCKVCGNRSIVDGFCIVCGYESKE